MSSSAADLDPKASVEPNVSTTKGKRAVETSSHSDMYVEDFHDMSRSSIETTNRSISPSSRELKFTRTGRVSKATKGERVHACDECGKVYTRAEHLRRHKKNHSPGMLPCDVPGCGRSFFREDLLHRHKQRHNDPASPPFRQASADKYTTSRGSSHFGERGGSMLGEYVSETRVAGSTITGNLPPEEGTISPAPEKPLHPRPFHDLPISQMSGSLGYRPLEELPRRHASVANIAEYSALGQGLWRRNSSPIRSKSPSQPYYAQGNPCAFDPYRYPNTTRSPGLVEHPPVSNVSDESIHQSFPPMGTPSSDMSTAANGHFNSFDNRQSIPAQIGPEDRDLLEQMDLQTPGHGIQDAELGIHGNEERYINSFWQVIHPAWPVVHRTTFEMHARNPLLKAAIVALGAQSSGAASDSSNARILHDRCIKVQRKRTNLSNHSYRLCDMQAMVLVELYSVYKSRRPPLQLSSCFENVFRRISNDAEAYPSTAPEAFASMPVFVDGVSPEVYREAKRRLLIACFILDRQHSTFFGRRAIDCRNISIAYLPFPQPTGIWDTMADAPISTAYGHLSNDHRIHEYTYEALNTIASLGQPTTSPYDTFRSSFLIASLKDVAEGQSVAMWKPLDDAEASALLYVVDHSHKTLLEYHMFMLAKNTPVRDLLAVAGESWVMAEKITSENVYSAAQTEVKMWASDTSSTSGHSNALYHALEILRSFRSSTTPGLLYRDWAVYMAALVIWITAYIGEDAASRQRLDVTRLSPHDWDRAVVSVVDAEYLGPISWTNAGCVLLWTQNRLQQNTQHNCGLTNGCLDVLGKLIGRGHENSWLQWNRR